MSSRPERTELPPTGMTLPLDGTGIMRWLTPWAYFVLALGAGRVMAGDSSIRIDEMVVGLPLAWLVAWVGARGREALSQALGLLLMAAGFVMGVLA